MHDDYYSSMNTPALNTENYDSVTTGHIPKDEEKICRFFAAKGKCYKGNKQKLFACVVTAVFFSVDCRYPM